MVCRRITLALLSEYPITAKTTMLMATRSSLKVKPACCLRLDWLPATMSAILLAFVRRAYSDSARGAYDDMSACTIGVAKPHPISARCAAWRKRNRAFFHDNRSLRQRLGHQGLKISLNCVAARPLRIRELKANVFRGGAHLDAVEFGLNLSRRVVQRVVWQQAVPVRQSNRSSDAHHGHDDNPFDHRKTITAQNPHAPSKTRGQYCRGLGSVKRRQNNPPDAKLDFCDNPIRC